jgi:hypothetical protein
MFLSDFVQKLPVKIGALEKRGASPSPTPKGVFKLSCVINLFRDAII